MAASTRHQDAARLLAPDAHTWLHRLPLGLLPLVLLTLLT